MSFLSNRKLAHVNSHIYACANARLEKVRDKVMKIVSAEDHYDLDGLAHAETKGY